MPVALGYSEVSGIPIEMALVKNRYVHRTFIEPDQKSRRNSVALKLIPLPQVLKGKKMPGRMGGVQVTIKNLEVVKIDVSNNLLYLKGAVPGANGNFIAIKE